MKRVIYMNVSGISTGATAVDMANTRMMPSLMVLDMEQDVFENIASMLIDALNEAIPGLGENVDLYV